MKNKTATDADYRALRTKTFIFAGAGVLIAAVCILLSLPWSLRGSEQVFRYMQLAGNIIIIALAVKMYSLYAGYDGVFYQKMKKIMLFAAAVALAVLLLKIFALDFMNSAAVTTRLGEIGGISTSVYCDAIVAAAMFYPIEQMLTTKSLYIK